MVRNLVVIDGYQLTRLADYKPVALHQRFRRNPEEGEHRQTMQDLDA